MCPGTHTEGEPGRNWQRGIHPGPNGQPLSQAFCLYTPCNCSSKCQCSGSQEGMQHHSQSGKAQNAMGRAKQQVSNRDSRFRRRLHAGRAGGGRRVHEVRHAGHGVRARASALKPPNHAAARQRGRRASATTGRLQAVARAGLAPWSSVCTNCGSASRGASHGLVRTWLGKRPTGRPAVATGWTRKPEAVQLRSALLAWHFLRAAAFRALICWHALGGGGK